MHGVIPSVRLLLLFYEWNFFIVVRMLSCSLGGIVGFGPGRMARHWHYVGPSAPSHSPVVVVVGENIRRIRVTNRKNER